MYTKQAITLIFCSFASINCSAPKTTKNPTTQAAATAVKTNAEKPTPQTPQPVAGTQSAAAAPSQTTQPPTQTNFATPASRLNTTTDARTLASLFMARDCDGWYDQEPSPRYVPSSLGQI